MNEPPENVGLAHALVRDISDNEFEATSNEEYQTCEVSREYGGIMQRWFVVQSKQAREREWVRAVEKIEETRKKEQKEFEALGREVFGCQKDTAIALKKITKKWRYQKVEEEELEEVTKYAGKGRPKKGEKPTAVGWKITGKLVVNEGNRSGSGSSVRKRLAF